MAATYTESCRCGAAVTVTVRLGRADLDGIVESFRDEHRACRPAAIHPIGPGLLFGNDPRGWRHGGLREGTSTPSYYTRSANNNKGVA